MYFWIVFIAVMLTEDLCLLHIVLLLFQGQLLVLRSATCVVPRYKYCSPRHSMRPVHPRVLVRSRIKTSFRHPCRTAVCRSPHPHRSGQFISLFLSLQPHKCPLVVSVQRSEFTRRNRFWTPGGRDLLIGISAGPDLISFYVIKLLCLHGTNFSILKV